MTSGNMTTNIYIIFIIMTHPAPFLRNEAICLIAETTKYEFVIKNIDLIIINQVMSIILHNIVTS